MTLCILRVICLATILVAAHRVIAQADATPTVGFLADHAKVVLVGRMSSDGSAPASTTLSLNVVRVLQGNLLPGSTITVQRNTSLGCTAELPDGTAYGIWFLNNLPNGQFELSTEPKSQSCGFLGSDFEMPEAAPPQEWSYSQSAPLKDKLAYELGWSIMAHDGDGPLALLKSTDLLNAASHRALLDIYKKLFDSPVPNIHLIGLTGLIRLADPAALASLDSNLRQLGSVPLRTSYVSHGERLAVRYGANGEEKPTFESEIGESLSSIVDPSPKTVRSLAKLLNSPDASPTIRHSVAYALQNIHTAATLPYLASLLDDADPELRADAIGGLSCFANGVPILINAGSLDLNQPSDFKTPDTLRHFAMGNEVQKKESYYLAFWKSWWTQNKISLLSSLAK